MSNLIVVVDSEGALGNAIAQAFSNADVSVECMPDVTAAKRGLVTAKPNLMVCFDQVDGDAEAGFNFCRELSKHTVLSKIPFVLATGQVSQAVVQRAAGVGAKAILPWPSAVDVIAQQLSSLLPGVAVQPQRQAFAAEPQQAAKTVTPQPVSRASVAATVSAAPIEDEKIKIAQQLLAKVLHNLKTSDLLGVVENEDVPRVVLEMTRSVCGVEEGASTKRDEEVSVDLDQIFGKSG